LDERFNTCKVLDVTCSRLPAKPTNPSIHHHSHTKPTTKKEKRKLPTPTWHETCLMYVCTQRMLDMKAVQGTKGWDQRKKQGKVGGTIH
jgi:hypothetical protein